MSNQENQRHALLISLLRPLVAEWGASAIVSALARFKHETAAAAVAQEGDKQISDAVHTVKYRKPAVSTLFLDARLSADKRTVLIALAENFNNKTFLPSMPDVRNFLEIHGHAGRRYKARQQAFGSVVEVLLREDADGLKRMLDDSAFSGPAELGPLSEAIAAAGLALRSGPPQHGGMAASEATSDNVDERAGVRHSDQ